MDSKAEGRIIASVLLKLAEIIPSATTSVKVCVPSTDYYSRSADWSEEYIDVVSQNLLVTLLLEAAQELSPNEGE